MASSSQSLDFSFDALRDFGSRLFRDRPNEARKLPPSADIDPGGQSVGQSAQFCLGSEAQVDSKATFTFRRVNGAERRRTPVASKTAFEIDAGTMALEGSPAPNGGSVGRSISSITISGTSGKEAFVGERV